MQRRDLIRNTQQQVPELAVQEVVNDAGSTCLIRNTQQQFPELAVQEVVNDADST